MKEEKCLLRDLQKFLLKKRYVADSNIISLMEFCNIINEELNEFRNQYIDFNLDKELKKLSIINLNSSLKSIILSPYLSYWKINSKYSSSISFEYNYRNYFEFTKNINKDHPKCEYYFSGIKEKQMINFVKSQYKKIIKMFELLEDYYDLVGSSSCLDCYKEKINTVMFNITLNIDNSSLFSNEDMLNFKIGINPNYRNSSDLYYGSKYIKNRIYNIIDKNSFKILDKIYIDVTKLPEPFITIYQKHIERNKEKQLVIKR